MAEYTQNLNLEKPAENENFRRQILNDNMEKIDKKFSVTVEGHTHDGTAGQGRRISYSSLEGRPTAMVPTAHKASHATGGSDVITPADIGAETPAGAQAKADMVKAELDGHVRDRISHIPYAVAIGTANAYAVTLSPAPTTYVDGMALCVKINVASTGSSTINVNGLGAKTILDSLGNVITPGGLKENTPYTLRYNGTNFIVQGKGGGGDASPNDILLGKTAMVDSGQITGNLVLTGNATGDDVAAGKTFYNTDPKTIVTGTGENAKRVASGTGVSASSGVVTVNGLAFAPSVVIVGNDIINGGQGWRKVYSSVGSILNSKTCVGLPGSVMESGAWTITSNGFSTGFFGSGAISFNWIAFE